MNNTLAGRVELWFSGDIGIRGLDGNFPEGAFAVAAHEAIDRAVEVAGGLPYHSDNDTWLDLQSDGGDYDTAIGAIVAHLAYQGFPVIVVQQPQCPACQYQHPDGKPDCPTCGGKGDVDNRAF